MKAAPVLYVAGLAGVVLAVAGEISGGDGLARIGYLVAVVGLIGGFAADRRR